MAHLIDKDALVAEIKRRIKSILEMVHPNNYDIAALQLYKGWLSFLDTLEVKEIVTEQEGMCNGILNTIIGDTWHIKIPLDKAGLKHWDKVKIFITKENK